MSVVIERDKDGKPIMSVKWIELDMSNGIEDIADIIKETNKLTKLKNGVPIRLIKPLSKP